MPLDLSAGGLPVSELGLVFVIAVIIVVVWAGPIVVGYPEAKFDLCFNYASCRHNTTSETCFHHARR